MLSQQGLMISTFGGLGPFMGLECRLSEFLRPYYERLEFRVGAFFFFFFGGGVGNCFQVSSS